MKKPIDGAMVTQEDEVPRYTICLDFDGVIHKYGKGWHDGTIYDEPMEGAVEVVKKLRKKYRVIVFTVRENVMDVMKWCIDHKILVHGVTNIKIPAIAYVDDHAIRFTSWTAIEELYAKE